MAYGLVADDEENNAPNIGFLSSRTTKPLLARQIHGALIIYVSTSMNKLESLSGAVLTKHRHALNIQP